MSQAPIGTLPDAQIRNGKRAGHACAIALISAGSAVWLHCAFFSPVVLWSDSRIDLDWAQRGIGIVSAVPAEEQLAAGVHQAKPVYLAFLRVFAALEPSPGTGRAIVIAQSLLLLAAIFWVSGGVTRRSAVLCLLILFGLRLRDSASTVMSEALAAAVLLAVGRGVLAAPQTWIGAGALGAAVGALFWIRPNVGLIAALLVAVRYLFARRLMTGLRAAAGFLVVALPVALATRPGPRGPSLRGLAYPLLVGSTEYCWEAAVPPVRARDLKAQQEEEISKTWDAWGRLWQSLKQGDSDARRQLIWRALHGFLGTEYYDARWSAPYLALTTASRLALPWLLLAAVSAFLTLPFQGPDRSLNAVVLLLVALLVGQSLLLGSLPRYALPFLGLLIVFGVHAAASLRHDQTRIAVVLGIFLLLVSLVANSRHVLDWEWGRVESAAVTLRQVLPKGSLPKNEPATLHIRIGVPTVSATAQFDVYSSGEKRLFSSAQEGARGRPTVSIRLPQWLLDQNAREPLEVQIVSTGAFSPGSFLLFPVIPPPWTPSTIRVGSGWLSPTTGIRKGSLDWWAHPGADPASLSARAE